MIEAIVLALALPTSTPLEYTQADIDEVLEFAATVISDDVRNSGFAHIDIRKRRLHDDSVQFTFEGRYAIKPGSGGIGIQRVLKCEVTRRAAEVSKSCTVERARMLAFGGIDQPVELAADVDEGDARLVLQFLAGRVGTPIEHHEFGLWAFKRISHVAVFRPSESATRFEVAYHRQGLCMQGFTVTTEKRQGTLELQEVYRSASDC